MSDLELGKKRAEELGLSPDEWLQGFCYWADDVHHFLGKGVSVFSEFDPKGPEYSNIWRVGINDKRPLHQAILIGIHPVAQGKDNEIAEKLAQINKLSKEIEALLENKE